MVEQLRQCARNRRPLIAAHPLHMALGESDNARRSRYQSLFSPTTIPEAEITALRSLIYGEFALGSGCFQR